jgi:hypothetical protein
MVWNVQFDQCIEREILIYGDDRHGYGQRKQENKVF